MCTKIVAGSDVDAMLRTLQGLAEVPPQAGAELTIVSAPEQVFCMLNTMWGGSHVFSPLIPLEARGAGYWCHWMERGRPPSAGRAKHESPEPRWRRMNGPPRRTGSQCSEAHLLDPGFGGSLRGAGGTAMFNWRTLELGRS